MKKSASILDYSYPFLDPAVWDHEMKLYTYQKDFLLRLINKMYETYQFKESEKWVTDIIVIGSLTTSKWLLTSDLDVHLKVNLDAFIASNMPGTSKEDAFKVLDNTRLEFDRAKILAPMTQHPAEFYFQIDEFVKTNTSLVGVYSLITDSWLKEPVIFEADLDFEESKKQVMAQAEALAAELDASFGKIKRQVARVDELEAVIKAWGHDKQELFYKKIEDKLALIEQEILKDIQLKQTLVDARHAGQDALSETEVKFKWLARFGYFGILSNLKKLMEDTGGKLAPTDLPMIEKIISQAAKRTVKNPGLWEGQKFWSGMADARDGQIYEVHPYEEAEQAGFHHSFYVSTELQGAMRDGEALFFWVDPDGSINTAWGNNVEESMQGNDAALKEKIRSQISINKAATLKEAFIKEVFEKETETDICIDLDRTIAKPAKFPEIGEPIEGAKEALEKLQELGYKIVIYSCRSDSDDGVDKIREYLDKHDIPYDSIFEGEKPFAKFYIDDHAIKFDNWDSVLKQVEKSEKKASLSITAKLTQKYWIDPSGKEFPVEHRLGHQGWVGVNILKKPVENLDREYGVLEDKADEMIREGWTRITTESDYDFAMEVADIKNLPSYLDNFIANHYTGGGVEIDDLQGNYQDVSDPFPSLRKAIYQSNRLRNAASLFSKKDIIAQTKKVKQGNYSCVMALVPHDLAQEIVAWGVRNVPDEDLYLDGDKFGRELEAHVTIKYGLFTDDGKDVRRSFNDSKPFKAKLGKVRHFEPPELPFDVLTVEVISEDLQKANAMICDKFECEEGLVSDEYKPHITIAYMKRGDAKEYVGADEFEGKEVVLDTVIFSPNKGNRTYFSIGTDKESSFVLEKLNKFASNDIGYWVDPKGNVYDSHGEGLIHNEWVLENLKMLQKKYGLNIPKELYQYAKEYFAYVAEGGENADMPASDEVWNQMLQTGWIRVGDASGEGIGIEVNSLRSIPSFMDSLLMQDLRDGDFVRVEDINHKYVDIQYPFKNLQSAVNQALGGQPKQADFLPSLTTQAPDNDWQFAGGGDDKEIALNPDSVSDDETSAEPCTTGKPRSKEVWRQFISMFSNLFSKKDTVKIESYDKELEEVEKKELGEDETLLDYSRGFYDPKKHDFPHNTTWDSLTQDGEPSKPTSVTYSPQISNEDNLDQNSPGGFPRRFMGKPKGEWVSNQGEATEALINMFKNREAILDSMTIDITAGSQSASVPDYLIDEWKTDQLHDDISEEPYVNHDQRDYPYGMHDSPENTGYNIGWPKDNSRAVVRLDTLENPAFRLDPFGIGEYNVTYYTAMPASDGIEATNPD